MDHVLAFFSDLILFTAGLGVCAFWIVAIVVCIMELWDALSGYAPDEPDEEEMY